MVEKQEVRSQTVFMRITWRGQEQFSLITAVSQPGRETESAIALEERSVIALHKLNS
ncbi:MAG: hypothetical protein V7K90_14865 [Nostoc sp.]|uniref:hypothetical protein n=1 Tax=Nostoc sp. TaxID=1180 RepID=UPI002FFC9525